MTCSPAGANRGILPALSYDNEIQPFAGAKALTAAHPDQDDEYQGGLLGQVLRIYDA